jgi:hypothetical protein
MDKKFRVSVFKGANTLDGSTKLKIHGDEMHVFLFKFISMCYPGESIPHRLAIFINELPQLPTSVGSNNSSKLIAQAA